MLRRKRLLLLHVIASMMGRYGSTMGQHCHTAGIVQAVDPSPQRILIIRQIMLPALVAMSQRMRRHTIRHVGRMDRQRDFPDIGFQAIRTRCLPANIAHQGMQQFGQGDMRVADLQIAGKASCLCARALKFFSVISRHNADASDAEHTSGAPSCIVIHPVFRCQIRMLAATEKHDPRREVIVRKVQQVRPIGMRTPLSGRFIILAEPPIEHCDSDRR